MALFLLLALSLQAGPADPAAIAAAGARTAAKFRDTAASWTSIHQTPQGARFRVDVVKAGDRRRLILSAEAAGQTLEFARILERDGIWHVIDGETAGKYRPYEAPLSLSMGYLYLMRSEIVLIADAVALQGWTRQGVSGDVATFRTPIPDSLRVMLEKTADQIAAMDPTPALRKSLADTRDLLEHGLAMRIDVKTGMVVESANVQRRNSLSEFRWLDRVDEKEFAVPDRPWTDVTGDPTAGDPGELVMMGHNGLWRPGLPKGELDARLLDLKTGSLRRVPHPGATAIPGCFLKDRTKVVVSAVTNEGSIALFEVDLRTGANRQLGGKLLETGFALFPSLSPDGKSIAALHRSGSSGVLDLQVAVIDLKTSEATHVGKPLDTAFLSWMPDGKGFLLLKRESPAVSTISRMDLEGRLTALVKGTMPVLLDGRSILFLDESDAWRTCDLQGKNVKTAGDGLPGMRFPSPAPDGRRLLMMRFRSGQSPEPVLLSTRTWEATSATRIPGMWGMPAWR